MALLSGRRLFSLWFWWAVPLFVGALVIAFVTNLWLGLLVSVLYGVWYWDSGATTCSRCGYYGTGGCGLQSLLIPLLFRRQAPGSISPWRIRLHFYVDLFFVGVVNALYCLYLPLLPVMVLWTAGAWWISFGPKRHHGMLHRLKDRPAEERPGLLSLPLVSGKKDEAPLP